MLNHGSLNSSINPYSVEMYKHNTEEKSKIEFRQKTLSHQAENYKLSHADNIVGPRHIDSSISTNEASLGSSYSDLFRDKFKSVEELFSPFKRYIGSNFETLFKSSDNTSEDISENGKSKSVEYESKGRDIDSRTGLVSGVKGHSVSGLEKADSPILRKAAKTPISYPTTEYIVQGNDTLTSIAARFNTVPSELCHINKLSGGYVFPGQSLVVPDNHSCFKSEAIEPESDAQDCQKNNKNSITNRDFEDSCSTLAEDDTIDLDCQSKFLKLNVRHITDGQGVVTGVLLVTPNAVMFDPNVSDPLVIEHGSEAYGVIAPMEFVYNSAIYYDIAHMRVRSREEKGIPPKANLPKPEIYFGNENKNNSNVNLKEDKQAKSKSVESNKQMSISTDESQHFLELGCRTDDDETESISSCGGYSRKDGAAFPKAFESELITPENSPTEFENKDDGNKTQVEQNAEEFSNVLARRLSENLSMQSDSNKTNKSEEDKTEKFEACVIPENDDTSISKQNETEKKAIGSTVTLNDTLTTSNKYGEEVQPKSIAQNKSPLEDNSETGCKTSGPSTQEETRKQKVFKRLSQPLQWMESLSTESVKETSSGPPSCDMAASSSVFSKVFSRSNSDTNKKSLQASADSKIGYKSLVSVEDMPELFASFDKLLPRPAKSCDDPPLYLRLRMGRPIGKKFSKKTPVMSYGKKKMRSEYWFSIPRDRVDSLYKFLMMWVPDTYGDIEYIDASLKGYELIDSDTEIWDDDLDEESASEDRNDAFHAELKDSWDAISMNDEFRRAFASMASFDMEMPELVGSTEILQEEQRKLIAKKLPPRIQGYAWSLIFSTSMHGFSLKSLYRKMENIDSPVLLVVQDTYSNTFGALLSHSIKRSELFYGTGESFLFSFCPEFKIFKWSGDNQFFIKGNEESLAIGAGDGHFGIFLDGDLYQGRTQKCQTFQNDILTTDEDFIIKSVECWGFE